VGLFGAYRRLLADILERGKRVPIGESLSVASGQTTIELLNQSFTLNDPRDRALLHPLRCLNILSAVGRLTWILAGNSRLRDIEYYEPAAHNFSDDGLTISGSAEGARLFCARPGLNQIGKVVELLQRERNTRRGAVVTYFPEDVGRVSRDIPCTLALVYNIRDNRLHATTLMRANDALRILPYDVFLFSMLAEIVATAAGAELATYHHSSVSMHIYERDMREAEEVVAYTDPPDGVAMDPMPEGDVWSAIRKLVDFESRARLDLAGSLDAYEALRQEALEGLQPYWRDFALVVLLTALSRMNLPEEVSRSAEAATIARITSLSVRRLLEWRKP
jgi:thymidylate synthase